MKPIVIIGSGHAGITLARELRVINKETPIILITQESGSAYYKPNLSKAISLGKSADDLVMKNVETLKSELNIFIKTLTRVESIDTEKNTIVIKNRLIESIIYKELILAIGATPFDLPIEGDGKNDVVSVNNLDDYRQFKEKITNKRNILIIGAGFVGIEFASDLFASDYQVTVVDMEAWPLKKALPQQMGETIVNSFPKDRVDWHFGVAVTKVERQGNSLDVTLSCGKKLTVDMVLSAVGIRSNTCLAKDAKIKVNRGIVVDEYLRTNINNVYAIGDCAEISGHTLPFIAPATFAAKALAKTLLAEPTTLNIPNLAVAVKIPTCPTVVCPSLDLAGNWVVEGDAPDFIARFMNAEKTVTGFALTGKEVSQKMTLLKECVAPQLR